MSRIFAAMHSFEIQARVSNDALRSLAEGQSANLQRKVKLANLVDKLSKRKGDRPSENELKEAGNAAVENAVKTAWGMISKGPFPPTVRQPSEQIDRIGDHITELNTRTQRYLSEANDGEARVAELFSEYKGFLQEMRK